MSGEASTTASNQTFDKWNKSFGARKTINLSDIPVSEISGSMSFVEFKDKHLPCFSVTNNKGKTKSDARVIKIMANRENSIVVQRPFQEFVRKGQNLPVDQAKSRCSAMMKITDPKLFPKIEALSQEYLRAMRVKLVGLGVENPSPKPLFMPLHKDKEDTTSPVVGYGFFPTVGVNDLYRPISEKRRAKLKLKTAEIPRFRLLSMSEAGTPTLSIEPDDLANYTTGAKIVQITLRFASLSEEHQTCKWWISEMTRVQDDEDDEDDEDLAGNMWGGGAAIAVQEKEERKTETNAAASESTAFAAEAVAAPASSKEYVDSVVDDVDDNDFITNEIDEANQPLADANDEDDDDDDDDDDARQQTSKRSRRAYESSEGESDSDMEEVNTRKTKRQRTSKGKRRFAGRRHN